MSQLFAGSTFVVLGIVLLVIYDKAIKSQKENTTSQTPYLKNGGIGFLLFNLTSWSDISLIDCIHQGLVCQTKK